LEIVYTTTHYEKRSGAWTNKTIHTEYQPYEITWCGDGIVDNYIDPSGLNITESCDPNDPSKSGWGNGGCAQNTCTPITVSQPATCNQLQVNPTNVTLGNTANIVCNATNTSTYKLVATRNGQEIASAPVSSIGYVFPTAGTYEVSCFVDNQTVTPAACKQTVVVTPPVVNPNPVCTGLSVTPSTGSAPVTSALSCTGTNVSNYKIDIKNSAGAVVNTINNNTGNYTFPAHGNYTASCFVNNQTTTPSICTKSISLGSTNGPTPNI
jgi:hypothetical protein